MAEGIKAVVLHIEHVFQFQVQKAADGCQVKEMIADLFGDDLLAVLA